MYVNILYMCVYMCIYTHIYIKYSFTTITLKSFSTSKAKFLNMK